MTENKEKFYIDEPVVVSYYIGSLKNFIMAYHGYYRYLRRSIYQDHKMFMMIDFNWFFMVKDFVTWCIDLPDFFKNKNLIQKNYEAVYNNEEFTDPKLYKELQQYIFQFYNRDKAVESWCPRSDSSILKAQNQIFDEYKFDTPNVFSENKPVLTINPSPLIKPYTWAEIIEMLLPKYNIVLYNNTTIQCNDILNVSSLEEFCKYSKYAYLSISAHDDYAYIPFLIRSRGYVISTEEDGIIQSYKKMKTPLAYKGVTNYSNVDSKEVVNEINEVIKTFKSVGKI